MVAMGPTGPLLRLLAAESLTGVELSETCFDPLDPQKTQIIG